MNSGLNEFSVYNNLLVSEIHKKKNPLAEVAPHDLDTGWHIARNLLKPLNHLELLNKKESIAASLNLHSTKTPSKVYNKNYLVLDKHQKEELSTDQVINYLHNQLDAKFSDLQIREMLIDYASVTHMEFHPTDLCNLACNGCTYGHDDPALKPPPIQFPYDGVGKVLKLKPRSMVLIGGGEPTLYRDPKTKYRFQELIEEIIDYNPNIQLSLVTNGTFKPPGDWPKYLSWIRVSLDAASQETYKAFRNKELFHQVVNNFMRYLEENVKYVGVSFLFANTNVHEYAKVAEFLYYLVKKENPNALPKLNIQYRPIRRDPYRYNQPFTEAISEKQINQAIKQVINLADSSKEMKGFLKNQTNITAILGGNSHPPHEFSRCLYSQIFRIVRANGDLRPCFIRVVEKDFILGNILNDPLESIALNTLYVSAKRKNHCNEHGCRQCHVNYTLEQGLLGTMKPSLSKEVKQDLMF